VRLAAAGQGFGAESEETVCEVTSRAFTMLPDATGSPVIVSFFDDPRGQTQGAP